MTARVHMRRHSSGLHVAAIDIPTSCGALRVTGVGSWFSDALSTAASVATRITSDPIVQAILPPQATMAINAVKAMSTAAQQGAPALRSVMKNFSGPGKQRLARVLHTEAKRRDVVDPVSSDRRTPQRRDAEPEMDEDSAAERAAFHNQGAQGDDRNADEYDNGDGYDGDGDNTDGGNARDHRGA